MNSYALEKQLINEKVRLPSVTDFAFWFPPTNHLLRSSLSLLLILQAAVWSRFWPLVLSQVAALEEVRIGGRMTFGGSLELKEHNLRESEFVITT